MYTSSMSFFLFSFQVHEKSVLLPLMPLTVMMALRDPKERGSVGLGSAGQQRGGVQVGLVCMSPLSVD